MTSTGGGAGRQLKNKVKKEKYVYVLRNRNKSRVRRRRRSAACSKFHRNPFRGFGATGRGGRNLAIPITLAIGFYFTTACTVRYKPQFYWRSGLYIDAMKHAPRGLLGKYPRRRHEDEKYETKSLRLNNNAMTSLAGLGDLVTSLVVQPDALRWLDVSFNNLRSIDPVRLNYIRASPRCVAKAAVPC